MLGTTPESIKQFLPLMQQADKVMQSTDRVERSKLLLKLSDDTVAFATSILLDQRFQDFSSKLQ